MENEEILRLISALHREKNLDKEILFRSLEAAMETAARKRYNTEGEVKVVINRNTGEIRATEDDELLDLKSFGRIAAQTAKQVMIQKLREAESDVVFNEFEHKVNDIVNGVIMRIENGNVIVSINRTESLLMRSDQVFNETYTVGERLRCMVVSVKKKGQRVLINLSRSNPNFVKELFKLEVPEISDRIIEIKAIAREAGHRTKIAVQSHDAKVDCIGACVGVRGSRIRTIVEELNGEKIDIVPWSDNLDVFIVNSLSPAEITSVTLNKVTKRARVVVPDDQLSLAIGKRGQNVRLSHRLTGWHIDVISESEMMKLRELNRDALSNLPGMKEGAMERFYISGIYTLDDLIAAGKDHLIEMQGLNDESAEKCIAAAAEVNTELKNQILIFKAQMQKGRKEIGVVEPEYNPELDTVVPPGQSAPEQDGLEATVDAQAAEATAEFQAAEATVEVPSAEKIEAPQAAETTGESAPKPKKARGKSKKSKDAAETGETDNNTSDRQD